MSGFFDSKQLVSPDHHLVHFEGEAIFLESELLLCSDDFMVAALYGLVAIINLFQMGLQPEATLSNAARGLYFLLELLAGCIDRHFLSIQTCDAVTSC